MTRLVVTVEVNLDDVPGAFHDPDDAAERVGQILRDRIGHYDPNVTEWEVKA